MRILFASTVLAAACLSPAVNIVIDDFTSATSTGLSQVGSGGVTNRTLGSMLGGSRGLGVFASSTYGLTSSINIVPGAGLMNNDTGNSAQFYFAYFTVGTIPQGWTYSPATDADMTGTTGFEIDALSSDKSFTVLVQVFSEGTQAIYTKAFGPVASPTTLSIGQADLSIDGGVDMSKVDLMWVGFLTEKDGDIAISQIRAVPEPASVSLLGLGALALLRKRRASK